MAKRLKRKDRWTTDAAYRTLHPYAKNMLEYVEDHCDCTGVWVVDYGLMAFMIGINVDEARHHFQELLGPWLTPAENTESVWIVLVKHYVAEQYGQLTPNNNFHRKVIRKIAEHKQLFPCLLQLLSESSAPDQPLASPCQGAGVGHNKKANKKRKESGGCGGRGKNTGGDPTTTTPETQDMAVADAVHVACTYAPDKSGQRRRVIDPLQAEALLGELLKIGYDELRTRAVLIDAQGDRIRDAVAYVARCLCSPKYAPSDAALKAAKEAMHGPPRASPERMAQLTGVLAGLGQEGAA